MTFVHLDVPGPPVGPIEFSDISAHSITVNWQPPEDTGGSEISNYAVDYREFGRATWSSVTSCITRNSIKVRARKFAVVGMISRLRLENNLLFGVFSRLSNLLCKSAASAELFNRSRQFNMKNGKQELYSQTVYISRLI